MAMDEKKRVLLYALTIPVRWGDMDALGHVNNAAYFSYMEQVRIGWLASVGAEAFGPSAREGSVIVNACCTFNKPVTYPATLRVQMHGGAPGRTSFESYYTLQDAAADVVYATGTARVVWVNYASGRAIPLPAFVRRHLPAEDAGG